MKQNLIIAVLTLALIVSIFMWISTRSKNSVTISNLQKEIKTLQVKLDDARVQSGKRETAEVDAFLKEYEPAFAILREREIDVYRRTAEADKIILLKIDKIRSSRKDGPFAKWTNMSAAHSSYQQMESRLVNMLKDEIRHCEYRIKEIVDGEEEINEYSATLKTYPRPLFPFTDSDGK